MKATPDAERLSEAIVQFLTDRPAIKRTRLERLASRPQKELPRGILTHAVRGALRLPPKHAAALSKALKDYGFPAPAKLPRLPKELPAATERHLLRWLAKRSLFSHPGLDAEAGIPAGVVAHALMNDRVPAKHLRAIIEALLKYGYRIPETK